MKRSTFLIGALIAALLQTAALGSILYDRARLLAGGTEVTIRSAMRDPRDLFRGHYVVLNLDVGLVTEEMLAGMSSSPGEKVFVELKPDADGMWTIDRVHDTMPESPAGPVVAGTIGSRVTRDGIEGYAVDLPFDRYFAPKVRALALERLGRDSKLAVILSVGKGGAAAIKGIVADGERIYDEPLL